MSNIYDFNPSGVSPLARLISSFIPPSSPDSTPPEPTPRGGLPAGAPTATPPGVSDTTLLPRPTFVPFATGLGRGLADLARQYLAAGQPSVWGTGAQSVDESGMVFPPEPQTEARAGEQPGQPSPMTDPRQPHEPFPPGVEPKPPESEKPDTTGSVAPTPPKAETPPSHEPFIPTPRNRPLSELGRPDLALQYAGRYPGILPAPYFPQPAEIPGVLMNTFGILGRLGSGIIGRAALGLSGYLPAYWAAQQRGEEIRQRTAAANFKLGAEKLAQDQARQSREYAEAFAIFGPQSKKYNEDALREHIRRIATVEQDEPMLAALNQGFPAVQELMRVRDAANQNGIKALTAANKYYDLKRKQQAFEEGERKRAAAQGQLEGYAAGAGGAAPAPGTPDSDSAIPAKPEAEPGEKTREWPADKPVDTTPPAETPETTEDTSETSADQAATETPETPEKTAETPAATPEAPAQAAAAPSPSEQLLAAAEGGGAPAAGGAPTRLAQADTGTATDAGPQRAAPPTAEMPEWLKRATEGGERRTPEGYPYYQGRPPAAAPTAEPGRLPESAFEPPKSKALDRAKNFVNPYTNQPMPLDQEGVNARARGLVNGTIKTIQGQKEVPQEIRNIDRMRANEMEAALDSIIAHPEKYKGDDVYKAIRKIANNPELAADLKSYVDGDVAVPSGSWNNLNFLKRIIALGHMVDDKFNAANFAVRARTKQSYANGADARNWTSVATLYLHTQEGIDLLREVEKRHPGILKEYLGASKLGTKLRGFGIGPSPEEQKLFARLDTVLGTVATEYVRATSGAAPTVTHRNEVHHGLDYKWNEESAVIDQLLQMRTLAEDRMKVLAQRYNTVLGVGAKKDSLADLLNGYAAGTNRIAPLEGKGQEGSGGYVKATGDDLGGYANPRDPRVQGVIQRFSRGSDPRDAEAIDWARKNPQDPRARQILERN